MKSKQIIVIRKDLKMRRGKEISQGAHASLKALLDYGYKVPAEDELVINYKNNLALKDWLEGIFTKITCVVETEEELLKIYNAAKEKNLLCSLITDAGLTEFNNIPTITCCAIGPAWSDELDEITGKLELF